MKQVFLQAGFEVVTAIKEPIAAVRAFAMHQV